MTAGTPWLPSKTIRDCSLLRLSLPATKHLCRRCRDAVNTCGASPLRYSSGRTPRPATAPIASLLSVRRRLRGARCHRATSLGPSHPHAGIFLLGIAVVGLWKLSATISTPYATFLRDAPLCAVNEPCELRVRTRRSSHHFNATIR